MFRAVTFDLWNTLVVEAPTGLLRPRVRAWLRVLNDRGVRRDPAELEAAHRQALVAYQEAWMAGTQFCSAEATATALGVLGLAADDALSRELEATFHEAGLDSSILATSGAVEVVSRLHLSGARTAVVCDIGLTPSSALVEHLALLGLSPHLDALTWSDELGYYKPHPRTFETTLDLLGVPPGQAIHVGDRLRTDVAGARAAGMTTVRYRGVFNDPEPLDDADYVIDDLRALLQIVQGHVND